MQLQSSDGQSFSLNVVRYEFPDEELGPNENNPADDFDRGRFLVVTISLKTPDGEWEATAPEMTTTELEQFANWLESVSSGQFAGIGAYFTERDLEFTQDEKTRSLNVHLSRDFLPPWSNLDVWTINIPIEQSSLSQAVSAIRLQLALFPHRPLPHHLA